MAKIMHVQLIDIANLFTGAIVYKIIWLGNTYYNFCYSANMLNIRSRRFDRAQCYWDYGGMPEAATRGVL